MKLFGKFREELIVGNKISRYLLYAIGEIILVVIGILIALAIDNYADNLKIREKEQTYLQGLKKEFEFSRQKLQELISVNRNNYEGAKKLLEYVEDNKEPPKEADLSALLFSTFASDIFFNPNNSLLDEMINSGSLKDISNDQLRIQLTNWISTLDDIAKQETDLAMQRERVVQLFRGSAYSIRTIFDLSGISVSELDLTPADKHHSNLSLLNSLEFENNLLIFILTSLATEKNHYTPLMQDVKQVLHLINSELNDN